VVGKSGNGSDFVTNRSGLMSTPLSVAQLPLGSAERVIAANGSVSQSQREIYMPKTHRSVYSKNSLNNHKTMPKETPYKNDEEQNYGLLAIGRATNSNTVNYRAMKKPDLPPPLTHFKRRVKNKVEK
jgi:hypothetical protein